MPEYAPGAHKRAVVLTDFLFSLTDTLVTDYKSNTISKAHSTVNRLMLHDTARDHRSRPVNS